FSSSRRRRAPGSTASTPSSAGSRRGWTWSTRSRSWRETGATGPRRTSSSSASTSELGPERKPLPEGRDHAAAHGGRCHRGTQREHVVHDEQHDRVERYGGCRDSGERETVPHLHEVCLVAVPEKKPVVRARSGEQRDRDRGREEGDHEHIALKGGRPRPAL